MPHTIADRLGEEGEGATMLWVYKLDGSKWERFARRMFHGIRFASTVHIDGLGRLAVAGMSAPWAWEDGMYGPSLKPGGGACRLEFYSVSAERGREEFTREQRARWAELHGNAAEQQPPTPKNLASVSLAAALVLEATYAFPWPACLHPLFALTGDGYAITACKGNSALRVMRIGYLVAAVAAEEGAPELAAAQRASASLLVSGRTQPLREAWAPPTPQGAFVRLLPSNASQLVLDVEEAYGCKDISAIAMDPSGEAFVLLDSGRGRVVSIAWPIEGVAGGEDPLAPGKARPPRAPRAVARELPQRDEETYTMPNPTQSWE